MFYEGAMLKRLEKMLFGPGLVNLSCAGGGASDGSHDQGPYYQQHQAAQAECHVTDQYRFATRDVSLPKRKQDHGHHHEHNDGAYQASDNYFENR